MHHSHGRRMQIRQFRARDMRCNFHVKNVYIFSLKWAIFESKCYDKNLNLFFLRKKNGILQHGHQVTDREMRKGLLFHLAHVLRCISNWWIDVQLKMKFLSFFFLFSITSSRHGNSTHCHLSNATIYRCSFAFINSKKNRFAKNENFKVINLTLLFTKSPIRFNVNYLHGIKTNLNRLKRNTNHKMYFESMLNANI